MQIIEQVAISNCTLWTVRQSSGPALVCCHGGPGLWDYLEPVAEMVEDLATVYRYDQRACGRSTGAVTYDLATAVADLEALREHWGFADWIVLGHSFGATLALAYVLAYPARTRALIYLSGTGIDPTWHDAYRANEATLFTADEQRQLKELKARVALAQGEEAIALNRRYCELSWSIDIADRQRGRELVRQLFVADFLPNYQLNKVLGKDADRFAENPQTKAALADLAVPTLVIHGDADPRPASSAQQLAAVLPDAQFALLSGVGHLPWLERSELLSTVLRDFLARL